MEQTAQPDILILILVFLSVLIGFGRGFSVEAARLAVYVFSGIFGYCLIPVFQPAFSSFIPHDKTAWTLSLAVGSFVSWIALRILTSSLVQNVKNSRFGRLDRSLGAVYGLGRGVVFLFLFSFFTSAVSPRLFEKSRLMQMSFAGMQTLLRQYPELNVLPQKTTRQTDGAESDLPPDASGRQNENGDWKKSAADYVLNTNVQTKSGEKTLLSFASGLIAEGMALDSGKQIPPEMIEMMLRLQLGNAAGDKKIQEMTPEEQKLFLQQIIEQQKGTE